MALMLALLRHVPDADASIRAGEWERGRYTGRELRGKTLGIIGLGKIGRAVARRAAGFEMRVIATDPFLTEDQAAEAGAKLVGLAGAAAPVRRHHRPHPAHRPDARPARSRAARGDEAGRLRAQRGARRDRGRGRRWPMRSPPASWPAPRSTSTRPSRWRPTTRCARAPNLVLTPHLGASTAEAQDRVGLEMAEQVLMALGGVTPPYAVNAPSVAPDTAPRLRPYVELGRRLAILARQLAPDAFDALSLTYAGEIAAGECAPIRTAALAGHPGGGHRPAGERRQRRSRRARARPHGPRDAHPVVRAVGLAGGAGGRPGGRRAAAHPAPARPPTAGRTWPV